MRRVRWMLGPVAAAVVLAACSGRSDTSPSSPTRAAKLQEPTRPPPGPDPSGDLAGRVEKTAVTVNATAAPQTDCGFTSPAAFQGRTVKWEGECADGRAHGNGVLRAYPSAGSADKSVLIFFGTLERGEPTLGVIDTPDGYIAGALKAGKVVANGDRNLLIRAFQRAAEAATFVSTRFKTAGNEGSAAFYAKKAHSLLQQMD
jgi:hypothetical protein